MATIGRIHSIESGGAVDGPGIRFVSFLQGCPLRCQYCHNPDTWKTTGGMEKTAQELYNEASSLRSYMKFSGGGVTVTGGEPLMQAEFVLEYFKLCKENKIHTAIDTSGYIFNDTVKEVLKYTDLVLLDIKNFDPERYKLLTSVELEPTLKFLDYISKLDLKIWIRYVLVPGLTDNLDSISELGEYLSQYNNIERIEVLPFHKMGEYKWETMGYKYQLGDTKEPSKELLLEAVMRLKEHNMGVSIR